MSVDWCLRSEDCKDSCLGSEDWGLVSEDCCLVSKDWCLGSEDWGFRSEDWCLGSADWCLGSEDWCLGFDVWCLGSEDWGLGFEVSPSPVPASPPAHLYSVDAHLRQGPHEVGDVLNLEVAPRRFRTIDQLSHQILFSKIEIQFYTILTTTIRQSRPPTDHPRPPNC